jgi:choice-of-anchor B domain-containing protein
MQIVRFHARAASAIRGGALLATLVAAATTSTLTAHEDDGKVRDRQRPVRAQVYREGQEGGVAGDFDALNIQLKSWHPLNTINAASSSGNDCWGYVSPSGREYALMCVNNGMAVYEVTDPVNAAQKAWIPGVSSLWRDVKTYDKYAYVVSEGGGGIQVVDLASIDAGSAVLVNTVTTGGTAASHNVAIDEDSGFLYRCGGGANGLRFYDLSNPSTPVFVGQWSDVYVHDAQIVTYTTGPYAGRQVAFCCGGQNGGNVNTGLYIVDVTNKAAPALMGSIVYPNGRYSHQGWLTEDRAFFLLGDELDEGATQSLTTTYVFNVQNLSAPALVGDFKNATPAITHNCYTHQRKMFAANYRSGLRVFNVTSPGSVSSVVETAYFDTYPGDDAAQFNGLWSVYPYFPSGTIIGSDLERGLFVWRLGGPVATFSLVGTAPELVDPAGGTTVDVTIAAGVGQQLDLASAKMLVDFNGQTAEAPLAPLGNGVYRATFMPTDCGFEVAYRFSVKNVQGDEVQTGVYTALSAAGVVTIAETGFEAADGWSGGQAGDTATTGQWVRVDPNATTAQPEDDHSVPGTICWITGNAAAGAAAGTADVDGGYTTLVSPAYDMSSLVDPSIEYWYWYSNNLGAAPGEDVMPVEISGDDGATWVLVENIATNDNAWTKAIVRVADFVTPGAAVRIRFRAQDLGAGSLVEAGIDDVRVFDLDCGDGGVFGDLNGDGLVNGADLAIMLSAWGTSNPTADLNNDGVVGGADLASLLGAWG